MFVCREKKLFTLDVFNATDEMRSVLALAMRPV